MPRYDYRCAYHGEHERVFPMGKAWPSAPCTVCRQESERIITAPNFQEDRSRFWSRNGSRYSAALGCELPESRSAIRALAREKGVELDAHEMPHIKRAAEVGRAKREGVNLTSGEIMSYINEPKEQAPTLLETLQKSGKMQAVSERIQVGYENWRDRGQNSEAAFAQRGAQALAAGPSVLNNGEPV